MTVKELITELKKYNDNQRVWIYKRIDAFTTERVANVNSGYITMEDDVIIS